MKESTVDYADYADYDRRQRGIETHVLVAFTGGLAAGFAGILTCGKGTNWFGQLYDPYLFLALSLYVGATASGLGWALLTTFLAAVSTLVAAMVAGAVRGNPNFDVIGGNTTGLDGLLLLLVALGVLAYFTRRSDAWGDLAAGVVGAALLADVIGRATPGFIDTELPFWPGPAALAGALAVGLVILMRRTARGRMRALAVSTVLAALFAAGVAASLAGWLPVAA
jgi:hypothetical protein